MRIGSVSGTKGGLVAISAKQDLTPPLCYAIDATKMNDKLNWQPEETFETGIRKTVAWYLASMLGKEIG